MKLIRILVLLCTSQAVLADQVTVAEGDFGCMLDMQPVRGFYVDNLIEGGLDGTLEVARAGSGDYPAGSVVQLVPGGVMVKHPAGTSPATRDWEFFELEVSAEGTEMRLFAPRPLASTSSMSMRPMATCCPIFSRRSIHLCR